MSKSSPEEEPKFDLFQIFTKKISDMNVEELSDTFTKVRELRKIKIKKTKKKSALDIFLDSINPINARTYLDKFGLKSKEEKKENKNE